MKEKVNMKKKRFLLFVILIMSSLLSSFAQFSGSGNGTEDDPYLIFNEMQLAQVSNFINQDGVVFKLMKDLDLSTWIADNNPRQGWLPIGMESMPFMGKFLGNHHKLSGLKINRPNTNYVGFFGCISGATIENLSIEGSSVFGAFYVGGFIGYANNSEITNCNLSLTDGLDGKNYVGGFVGCSKNSNYSIFDVQAPVKAQGYLGGFVGSAEGGSLQQGSVTGNNTNTGEYIGGVAGELTGISVSDIKQNGNVSGQNYTGGFVGLCSNVNFTRCNVEGDVSGEQSVSGFAGILKEKTSRFNSCFHKGTIMATGDYCGGIVGVSEDGCIEEMESCSHFGDIQGQNYVGGLIGAVLNVRKEPTLHIYKRENYTYVETMTTGSKQYCYINNCTSIGDITGLQFVGGLSGYDTTSKSYTSESFYEEASYNSWMRNGERVVQPRYFYNEEGENIGKTLTYYKYTCNTTDLSFINNYYSGTIHGKENVGGLIGYKCGGVIQNNYANGKIFASNNIGGIVGEAEDKMIIKSNVSICTSISSANINVGRIYGIVDEENITVGALGSSESNRALAQTKVIISGVAQEIEDDLRNGTSIGNSSLKLKANYVSWGWNFDNNWNILETESFPYKIYQTAPPVIESKLVSKSTNISGKTVDGGIVYLQYKDRDFISTESSYNKWSFNTDALQSGADIQIYAEVEEKFPSYLVTGTVDYPGSGTASDPWRIYTADDLQGASYEGYYKVMNDIDLTTWINENSPEKGWIPIGRNSGETTYIDGNGYTISGLWINDTGDYNGLFSNFSAGQIKNLNVEVATGKKVRGGDYTGILIGRNANGTIINCSVKGEVEGGTHVGGIVGYSLKNTMENVVFDGIVSANSEGALVGGLAGATENCEIINSKTTATIISNNSNSCAGGLVGYTNSGVINQSIAITNLTSLGIKSYIGGLVGYSNSTITKSYSEGKVSAIGDDSYTGGLVGYASSYIDNSYSIADVKGTLYSAGLVGYTLNRIEKCYATGNVEGIMYGAGIVGELDGPNASLTNSVAANKIISLSAQSSWGCRIIGGYKNGASDPNMSNYALNTMQVSLNNIPQSKTDDLVEGIAKSQIDLTKCDTYIGLGWDFANTWNINENNGYPYFVESESSLQITDITFDVNTLTLSVGDSETINVNILPKEAPIKELIWESSDINVATVSNGIVTAQNKGCATITATTTDGSNINSTCIVTVKSQEGESVIGDDTDISQLSNVLYIESMDVKTGEQTIIPIKMKNVNPIRGFQFDLYLPEGVTVAKNAKGRILALLNSERLPEDDEHTLTFVEQPDGAIRFLCSSLYDENFIGNDGDIVYLTVNVADDMEDGSYALIISNATMTETDISKFSIVDYVKSTLNVSSYILGDINNDKEVDVRDYTGVANHIMGNTPEGFIFKAGDVDESGSIDVRDYTGIANIIMTGTVSGRVNNISNSAMSKVATPIFVDIADVDNYIYVMDVSGNPDSQLNLSIYMKNVNPIRGFQFDLYLPEGVTVAKNTKGRILSALNSERLPEDDEHTLTIVEQSDGAIRFLCSSLYDENFIGNDGEIVNLIVNIADNVANGEYDVVVKNAIMTETDISKSYEADNIKSTLTVLDQTGVETVTANDERRDGSIYTVGGQLVGKKSTTSQLRKGIYIRNGRKFVVK